MVTTVIHGVPGMRIDQISALLAFAILQVSRPSRQLLDSRTTHGPNTATVLCHAGLLLQSLQIASMETPERLPAGNCRMQHGCIQ